MWNFCDHGVRRWLPRPHFQRGRFVSVTFNFSVKYEMVPFGAFSLLDTLKGSVNQRHPAVNIERGRGFKEPPPPLH